MVLTRAQYKKHMTIDKPVKELTDKSYLYQLVMALPIVFSVGAFYDNRIFLNPVLQHTLKVYSNYTL